MLESKNDFVDNGKIAIVGGFVIAVALSIALVLI